MSPTYRYGDELKPEEKTFLEAIVAVCKQHNLWLAHEDQHGAFEIWPAEKAETCESWLLAAYGVDKP